MTLSPQGRYYRHRPHIGTETAYPEFPDKWSILTNPALQNMSADELRFVAAVIDEARANSVIWRDE